MEANAVMEAFGAGVRAHVMGNQSEQEQEDIPEAGTNGRRDKRISVLRGLQRWHHTRQDPALGQNSYLLNVVHHDILHLFHLHTSHQKTLHMNTPTPG